MSFHLHICNKQETYFITYKEILLKSNENQF